MTKKRPVPPHLQLLSRLVWIACALLTIILILVYFLVPDQEGAR